MYVYNTHIYIYIYIYMRLYQISTPSRGKPCQVSALVRAPIGYSEHDLREAPRKKYEQQK